MSVLPANGIQLRYQDNCWLINDGQGQAYAVTRQDDFVKYKVALMRLHIVITIAQ